VHSRLEVYVPFLVIRRLGVISMSLMVVYRPTYNLLQMFVSSWYPNLLMIVIVIPQL